MTEAGTIGLKNEILKIINVVKPFILSGVICNEFKTIDNFKQ